MILKVDTFSFFLPRKAFRDCEAQGRLPKAKHKLWPFIQTKETFVKIDRTDPIAPFEMILTLDRKEIIEFIFKRVEEYKYATGILCKDGLFIHPEIFVKVLLKLSSKA